MAGANRKFIIGQFNLRFDFRTGPVPPLWEGEGGEGGGAGYVGVRVAAPGNGDC